MPRAKPKHVSPSLHPLVVPIDTLKPHPRNPRRGAVPAVRASLERFGQLKPIRFQQSTGVVIAGHHVLLAAQELGWKHVAAAPLDINDAEAFALMLADNRSADVADWDDAALAPILQRQAESERGLDGLGFGPDDVDDLLARLEALPETPAEPFAGGRAETPEEAAARANVPGERMQELVLVYAAPGEADAFDAALALAASKLGTNGIRETVIVAVATAAAVALDTPPPAPVEEPADA